MKLSFPFRSELGSISSYLVETFDQLMAAIATSWSREHRDDGRHGDVTANSLTLGTNRVPMTQHALGSIASSAAKTRNLHTVYLTARHAGGALEGDAILREARLSVRDADTGEEIGCLQITDSVAQAGDTYAGHGTVQGDTTLWATHDAKVWASGYVRLHSNTQLIYLDTPTLMFGVTANSDGSVVTANPRITAGSGTPEGSLTARIGSLYLRVDGGASTSLYIKESGTGNTGWRAV